MRNKTGQLNPHGFTLVELLVVVAIIALLVSILLPALGKAREEAKKVVCLSNCHQWGLSTLLYATDNRDSFPYRYNRSSLGNYRPEGSPGRNSPQYYHNTLNQNWSYIDVWLEPYLGDSQYTFCPASKNANRGKSFEEVTDATDLFVGDYLVYVGYTLDLMKNISIETWGSVEFGHKEFIPPLKTSEASSNMAIIGCSNYRYVSWGRWEYNHPVNTKGMEEPPGQPAAFTDGRAEWVEFDDLAVFIHSDSSGVSRDSWWPNPRR